MDGDRYDPIVQKYKPGLLTLAKNARDALVGDGFLVTEEPEEIYGDTFSVSLMLTAAGKDILLTIPFRTRRITTGTRTAWA